MIHEMKKVKRRRRSLTERVTSDRIVEPQESGPGHTLLARVSVEGPALVCGRGSPTSAAPHHRDVWGKREGERSWPAAHGPGEEPEVRAPGPRLAPPMPKVPQAMRSMRVARPQ